MKRSPSSWLKRTAVAAAVVLLTGLGIFVAFVLMYGFDTNTSQRVSGGGTQVASIVLTNFDVTPGRTLVVDPGTHLILDVVNRGDQAHDLAVDGGVRTLSSDESQRLDLGIVSEHIDMVCTRSLHEFLGMKLHVEVVQAVGSPGISPIADETSPPVASGPVER